MVKVPRVPAFADQIQHGGGFPKVREIEVAFRVELGAQRLRGIPRSLPEPAVLVRESVRLECDAVGLERLTKLRLVGAHG